MRRLGILIAVAALLVAGGAYYALAVYPQRRMHAELDAAAAKYLPGYRVTYGDASYSPLSRRAVISGIVVETPQDAPAEQKFRITVDRIEIANPSLDLGEAWSRDAANPDAVAPDTALPVADRVALTGVALRGVAVSASFGAASVDKPRLYPWALLRPGVPSLRDFPASMATAMRAQQEHQPLAIGYFLPLFQTEAEIVLAIGHDGYAVDDFKSQISVPAAPNSPAMNLVYGFGRMTAASADRGVFGQGGIDKLSLGGAPFGSFAVDHAVVTSMDVRAGATLLLSGQAFALGTVFDGMKLGPVEYSGMSLTPATGAPIPLGTFTLSQFGFSQGKPTSLAMSWSGVRLGARQIPLPQVVDAFDRLGLQSATLSVAFAYDWDLAQKRVTLHDTSLKVDELGTLGLGMVLADVEPGLAVQSRARLVRLDLRYDDASLAGRALKARAAQGGIDPEALRRQLVAVVSQQGAVLGQSPQANAVVRAVIAFLEAPKSLTVEMAPPVPLGLPMLQAAALLTPDKAVSSFGLTVTANQ